MIFRITIFSALILTMSACVTAPPPVASPLEMPKKPLLKDQSYQIKYVTEHTLPKVKSVQLPAHKVSRNQTVKIVADKTNVTDTLYKQIRDELASINLRVVEQGSSDYILAIHQLDLDFIDDTKYQLQTSSIPTDIANKVSKLYPTQQCATINAQVSMRLTHRASGDVVWFGKSSIDSASFHREPLVYAVKQTQLISNELEVASFIHQQNTEQARMARANQKVSVPDYKTISKISELSKQQGPCNRAEINALTPMMQFYLTSILIDKIKVI